MKTTNIIQVLFAAIVITSIALSCKKEQTIYESDNLKLPSTSYDYVSKASFVNQNFMNPITNEGATLGRVLFYDKRLSLNNSISCGSCHKQELGFADSGAFSEGFKGEKTMRNSLSLANPGMESAFFWDLRTVQLEDLVLQPIRNHIEMGMDNTDNLITKLEKAPYYASLFEKAFGTKTIDRTRISRALAQFVRSMVSRESKFDEGGSKSFSNFSVDELRGKQLFFEELHCSGCHNGSNFNSFRKGNIGLDISYKDNGIGQTTSDSKMNGVFKVPSLRNVALSAPYMHDGRFKTLEEVVEHYNSGVQKHPNLTNFMKGFMWIGNGGAPRQTGCWQCGVGTAGDVILPLKMTESDKKALVAFLKTLTDNSFITDIKYSNPFAQN